LFLAVRLQHAFDKPIALSKSNAKMEEDDSTISIIKLIVGLISFYHSDFYVGTY
jgi:hypothetical protein